MIRNLLLDLDDTLINSGKLHARAYVEALNRYAPALAEHFDYERHAGLPTREVLIHLGVIEHLQECLAYKQERYREFVRQGELELLPGADAVVHSGRRNFVVTGASRAGAELALATTGLAVHLQGMVCADDCRRGKPDPEPFLLCLQRYTLAPEECLVVEDSPSGCAAARAAGLRVAHVHPRLPEAQYPSLLELCRALESL